MGISFPGSGVIPEGGVVITEGVDPTGGDPGPTGVDPGATGGAPGTMGSAPVASAGPCLIPSLVCPSAEAPPPMTMPSNPPAAMDSLISTQASGSTADLRPLSATVFQKPFLRESSDKSFWSEPIRSSTVCIPSCIVSTPVVTPAVLAKSFNLVMNGIFAFDPKTLLSSSKFFIPGISFQRPYFSIRKFGAAVSIAPATVP